MASAGRSRRRHARSRLEIGPPGGQSGEALSLLIVEVDARLAHAEDIGHDVGQSDGDAQFRRG
jgi:hypothetical protein